MKPIWCLVWTVVTTEHIQWLYIMGILLIHLKTIFLTHACTHVHACTRTHICTQTHTYTHTHKRMNWDLLVGKAPCGHSTMLLGKSHSHSTLLFGSLPSIALETVSMFMMILSHLFKKYCQQERLSRANSLYTFLPRVVNNVMSLVLCPLVVSQAPQHFRSSEVPASCNGSFARQSVSGYFPWLCHVQDSLYIHRSLCRWTSNTDKTASLGFSFHFWLFVANSLNLWGAIWVVPDWWFSADPSLCSKITAKRRRKVAWLRGWWQDHPKAWSLSGLSNLKKEILLLLFGCWFLRLVDQQPKVAHSECLLKPAFWSSRIQSFCVAGFQMALKSLHECHTVLVCFVSLPCSVTMSRVNSAVCGQRFQMSELDEVSAPVMTYPHDFIQKVNVIRRNPWMPAYEVQNK